MLTGSIWLTGRITDLRGQSSADLEGQEIDDEGDLLTVSLQSAVTDSDGEHVLREDRRMLP